MFFSLSLVDNTTTEIYCDIEQKGLIGLTMSVFGLAHGWGKGLMGPAKHANALGQKGSWRMKTQVELETWLNNFLTTYNGAGPTRQYQAFRQVVGPVAAKKICLKVTPTPLLVDLEDDDDVMIVDAAPAVQRRF